MIYTNDRKKVLLNVHKINTLPLTLGAEMSHKNGAPHYGCHDESSGHGVNDFLHTSRKHLLPTMSALMSPQVTQTFE
jgi:hypothetical protein